MSDQIVEPPNLHRQISTDTTHDYPVWNNSDDPFDFDMIPGTPGFHPNRDRRQLVAEIDRLVQENNRLIEEKNQCDWRRGSWFGYLCSFSQTRL